MLTKNQSGFYWLASYPKSGNTWLRIVLGHLLHPSSDTLNLNRLAPTSLGVYRQRINETLGFESGHLSHDEIDELRSEIYQWQSNQLNAVTYNKIHDAYTRLANGSPLLPSSNCLGALYIIRNPLDVAISMANHIGSTIDESIEYMARKDTAISGGISGLREQLRQRLLTWSLHVESWTDEKTFPVLVLRYEDMRQQTLETFKKGIDFLGLEVEQAELEKALENSRLEKLQQFEQAFGFAEKPAVAQHFFRKGMVGEWREVLTTAQRDRIISTHHAVMQRYGYLDNL